MRKITLSEKKVESVLKENEVLNLAQQNNSLKRKVQQFTENQKKMKNQLAEKDRIIMAYVQNQKANKK